MADLRIVDAPLLSTVKGTEKLPTGGEGNFSVSVNQVADFAKLKWVLATEGYVNNAVGNVQADLNLHKNNESNPHNVTKTQVGLGNVDNTADLDKPVSNATQSAIITANSGKADKSYVDSQDQLKADKTTVEASLLLKADKVDLTASKVSSDGGQTQQEINDFGGARWHAKSGGYELGATVKLENGDIVKSTVSNNAVNPNIDMAGWLKENLESVTELRNTNPNKKGLRVYVKSYHVDLNMGGGEFVSTQKSSLVDNGVTVFSSLNPLFMWVRVNYGDLTLPLAGTKGDDVYDDTASTLAAIATNLPIFAPKPINRYRFSAPIVLTAGQSLIGEGERIKVRAAHSGACFQLMGNSTLENFETYPASDLDLYNYIGVLLGNDIAGDQRSILSNSIKNIKPFFPKTAFKLTNASYWNTFKDIDCYRFKDYGIQLTDQANNNFFQFRTLTSNATATAIEGGYEYKYTEVTWEQAAIKVSGNQNVFIGGENAPSKWGVIIDPSSSGNRFIGMYGEHQLYPIKTAAGTENFYDSTASMGTMQIHPDSIVHGQSGKSYTMFSTIDSVPLAGSKALKSAWFFNEGVGNKVYDYSGNKNHLTLVNPVWSKTIGKWGDTLVLDSIRTSKINPIPLSSIDWTQPFTFGVCVKTPATGDSFVLTLQDASGRYTSISVYPEYWALIDYDKTTTSTTSGGKVRRSDIDGYSWVFIYFDPVNKTVSSVNTGFGIRDNIITPQPPRFSPWVSGGGSGISTALLGTRYESGLNGAFAFAGFWQRKLSFPEVSSLVNMQIPQLFPASAPLRAENQPNNSINLAAGATLADVISAVNALALNDNGLKDKLRSSGLMLP